MSLDTWKNTNDPSSNFVGIATTKSPGKASNYVDHQLVDPVAA